MAYTRDTKLTTPQAMAQYFAGAHGDIPSAEAGLYALGFDTHEARMLVGAFREANGQKKATEAELVEAFRPFFGNA